MFKIMIAALAVLGAFLTGFGYEVVLAGQFSPIDVWCEKYRPPFPAKLLEENPGNTVELRIDSANPDRFVNFEISVRYNAEKKELVPSIRITRNSETSITYLLFDKAKRQIDFKELKNIKGNLTAIARRSELPLELDEKERFRFVIDLYELAECNQGKYYRVTPISGICSINAEDETMELEWEWREQLRSYKLKRKTPQPLEPATTKDPLTL